MGSSSMRRKKQQHLFKESLDVINLKCRPGSTRLPPSKKSTARRSGGR